MSSDKLSRWYKNTLSGFTSIPLQRRLYEHDISVIEYGLPKKIRVPILEVKNIGQHMAIDEKNIGNNIYTVLTNRETGKIAMLANSLKSRELVQILGKLHQFTYKVKSITRDLSNSYDWVARQIFPNACQIADKFHIIKHILEAMQAVRVRYRQEILRDKRLKQEEHKYQEEENKVQAKEQGVIYTKKVFKYKTKYANNGESYSELLSRSRYLLFKTPDKWSETQKERSKALFEVYPEIKHAYYLSIQFRDWFIKQNIGLDIELIRNKLKEWYKNIKDVKVEEMLNAKATIERNERIIINYFKNGATNAIAENINSRIQRFFNINNGARDTEFFLFRIKNFFT